MAKDETKDQMAKALTMGRTSVTGSLQLFLGKIASTVIMAISTIVLGWFILEGDYGLYVVALIPATTLLLFQDWGIGSALIRNCARCRASNNEVELKKIIIAGLTFEVATGLVLTLLSVLMANFIATAIFAKPDSAFLIIFASATIIATSISTATQSIFVGFERMKLNSVVMVCQAVVQGITAPLLVFLGYGAFGAVLGFTLATVVSSMISLILLYLKLFRKLPYRIEKYDIIQTLKPLLHYGVPLAIGVIIAGISTQIYSFLMASWIVDNSLIGNYRIALNFAVLLTFFSLPISTVLFPAFSKIDPKSELKLLRTVFTSSVKYTALLLVPAALAMTVLAQPLIGTLYGTKWLQASTFLGLSVVGNILFIFGNMSVLSLFSAVGETKLIMKLNLLSLSVGIPLALLLIPPLGIVGVIIGSFAAGIPSMFVGLYFAWKNYGAKVDFNANLRILISSVLAAITSYLFLIVFNAADWIRLMLAGTIFLFIFFVAAPFTGAINRIDITNFQKMSCNLGIISKILEIPLKILEKIIQVIPKNETERQKKEFLFSKNT